MFENFFEHVFFKEEYAHLARSKIELYDALWWTMQSTAAIGLVKYLGTVASEIERLTRENQDTAEVEQLFGQIAAAIEDEMGRGRDPYGMMHHRLFLKQLELCGLSKPVWFETKLSEAIRDAFVNPDFRVGLTMMYVIETLAQRLFVKQKEIFSDFPDGSLPYTLLHLTLEVEHANQALGYEKLTYPDLVKKYLHYWSELLDQCHAVLTGTA